MLFVSILLLAAGAMAAVPAQTPRAAAQQECRFCVPEDALESCKKMSSDLAAKNVHLGCVSARDRLHCLQKVHNKEADVAQVDPHEVYVASKIPNQQFKIIKDIRSKDESKCDACTEAVALVHKDLHITNIRDLKGKKSCHSGIKKHSGFDIPVTKLAGLGVLGQVRDEVRTSRENELRALSKFFSKACLPGKRSADPALNEKLRTAYPNLCELCEHPDKCDTDDRFAGNEGAIRCLTEKGGDVAWTSEHQVKKHFGLLREQQAGAAGTTGTGAPAGSAIPQTVGRETGAQGQGKDQGQGQGQGQRANVDDFRILCTDGTKQELKGDKLCRWGACPWAGFITVDCDVAKLREVLGQANKIGEEKKAEWLKTVLGIDEKHIAVDTKTAETPRERLEKADAIDVIERDFGRKKPIRFCVTSDAEKSKCTDLARSAFSRGIRPAFDCVQKRTEHDCLKAIKDGEADIISLDGGAVHKARTEFNLKPISREQYGKDHEEHYYSVAVVKKGTTFQTLGDLRGHKSCHTGIDRSAGWNIPVHTLLKQNLINKHTCPYAKGVSEFFSGGSCVPGALAPENNPDGQNPAKLCSLCVGNQAEPDAAKREKTKCTANVNEDFFGYSGAFRCLASGVGDVAFVKHTTVKENTDGRNKENWANKLKSGDFELLCANGGRRAADQYKTCNLNRVPSHALVTSETKPEHEVEAIRNAISCAGELFSRRPDIFRLFGQYQGKKDLLFKDSATCVVSARDVSDVQKAYDEILKEIKTCVPQQKKN